MPARPLAGLERRRAVVTGTATANPLETGSLSGGLIDSSQVNAPPSFAPPSITSTTQSTTTTGTASTSTTPSSAAAASQSRSSGPSTSVIVAVGVVAFLIIVFVVIFFTVRSSKNRKAAQQRKAAAKREQWKAFERTGDHGLSNDIKAPQDWEHKPNFSNVPPQMPQMRAHAAAEDPSSPAKSTRSLLGAHARDTVPAAREQSNEYSASYLRSIYSAYDAQSVTSTATSTRERRSVRKSKSARELIAMQSLIDALDLSAEEARARQRATSFSGGGRDSQIPDFPLPPPAVFRAALGGSDWEQ